MSDLSAMQRFALRSTRVVAVLRAMAVCPPGYSRGLDRLWLDEPLAQRWWAIWLASRCGLIRVWDGGSLRPYVMGQLTDAGCAALAAQP